MDGPLGRGFDSPHLQKTEIQPCVGSLFLFVGTGSRNGASGKSRAGAGFCSVGGFWRTTGSQKRLPPPPYCRSVLLQLHITGRHFFYLLYINKLHNNTMHTQTRDSVHMNAMFYTVSVESGHANQTHLLRAKKIDHRQ